MKPLLALCLTSTTLLIGGMTTAATPEENIKTVQDFFAAYGQNDLGGIAAVMDEDVRWHIPGRHPLSGTKQGRAEVLAFFEQLGSAGFQAEQSISEPMILMWWIFTAAGRTSKVRSMSTRSGHWSTASRTERLSKQRTCLPIKTQRTHSFGRNISSRPCPNVWPSDRMQDLLASTFLRDVRK